MIKAGILTYHRSNNYGAVLQTYALYTKLKQAGYQVSIIDYWPEYRKETTSAFPVYFWQLSACQKLKALIRYMLTFRNTCTRQKRMQNFRSQYLNIDKNTAFTLGSKIPDSFDVCIYGSDQIWRKFKLRGFRGIDKTYFGENQNKNLYKIAYAASVGELSYDESDKITFGNLIRNFNDISVRESTLQAFILNNYKIKPRLVCDPTFLLRKSDWLNLISPNVQKPPYRYVLYYNIQPSDIGKRISGKIAEKFDLKVIELPQPAFQSIFKNTLASTAGPIEFLTLVKYADFIVSSSFHGVAFSIIFEKQFYALGMLNNSDRVLTVLDALKIRERYLERIEDVNFENKIDFGLINNSLSEYRETSQSFLFESIQSVQDKKFN